MRTRANDLKIILRKEEIALEGTLDSLDGRRRQMGQVCQRFVLHLAVFAVCASEQRIAVGLAANGAFDHGNVTSTRFRHDGTLAQGNRGCQLFSWLLVTEVNITFLLATHIARKIFLSSVISWT